MIISASRRTDIPAFHMEWFMSRIRAGWCATRNPMNANQVSAIDLSPEAVDAVVFWTRNPLPALPFLPELDGRGYGYLFQVTLTGYGKTLEPAAPGKRAGLDVLFRLSDLIGPEKVLWRFDPVISTIGNENKALDLFGDLCERLSGKVGQVTVSFMDLGKYPGAVKATREALAPFGEIRDFLAEDYREGFHAFASGLARRASSAGIAIKACGHDFDLSSSGIAKAACVDGNLVSALFGRGTGGTRDTGQRKACGCAPSKDIGAYRTCSHGCVYCYASGRLSPVRANVEGPFLVGDGDVAPPRKRLPMA